MRRLISDGGAGEVRSNPSVRIRTSPDDLSGVDNDDVQQGAPGCLTHARQPSTEDIMQRVSLHRPASALIVVAALGPRLPAPAPSTRNAARGERHRNASRKLIPAGTFTKATVSLASTTGGKTPTDRQCTLCPDWSTCCGGRRTSACRSMHYIWGLDKDQERTCRWGLTGQLVFGWSAKGYCVIMMNWVVWSLSRCGHLHTHWSRILVCGHMTAAGQPDLWLG